MLKTVSPSHNRKRPFEHYDNPRCSPHTITFLDSPSHFKRARTPSYQPDVLDQISYEVNGDLQVPTVDSLKISTWLLREVGSYDSEQSHDLFSTSEVRVLLTKAIEETKTKLKQQYQQALQMKLKEQHDNFVSFNRDNMSSVKSTDTLDRYIF
eukprot:TRINITY_DN1089_c0_g1_i3.p1 TRINITY_DN1089_c0_g1~~TRINITY_DN1089_c0_g1_i3.p1  ORF type:complete len:153 (-),score=18.64 TRINITY_DN1089_c0_g1_i3:461-919(-)